MPVLLLSLVQVSSVQILLPHLCHKVVNQAANYSSFKKSIALIPEILISVLYLFFIFSTFAICPLNCLLNPAVLDFSASFC